MTARWTLPALLFVLGIGAAPSFAAESIHLESGYLAQSVAGGHQLTLKGSLGGAATLSLNPNQCSLDAFGDPARCTRMAPRSVAVQLVLLPTPDPKSSGRRIFQVNGIASQSGATYTLIAPRAAMGTYRLIEHTANAKRVVTLTARAAPTWGTPGTPGTPGKPGTPGIPGIPGSGTPKTKPGCRNVTYRAQQHGSTVRIIASGMHPSTGYRAYFTDVPVRSASPQFRFVCEAPKGAAATVMVPYEVSREFLMSHSIKVITVIDGDGRRDVPVVQRK